VESLQLHCITVGISVRIGTSWHTWIQSLCQIFCRFWNVPIFTLASVLGSDRGMWWCSWLRHCATRKKVAGSIPDCVTGIFHWHNPSGRTIALGLTQPPIEMNTRNISWRVQAAGAYSWQPYHLHVVTVLKSGSLKVLEPSGPVQACSGIALFIFKVRIGVGSSQHIHLKSLIWLHTCLHLSVNSKLLQVIYLRLLWLGYITFTLF
jgi:hypothetical protein